MRQGIQDIKGIYVCMSMTAYVCLRVPYAGGTYAGSISSIRDGYGPATASVAAKKNGEDSSDSGVVMLIASLHLSFSKFTNPVY